MHLVYDELASFQTLQYNMFLFLLFEMCVLKVIRLTQLDVSVGFTNVDGNGSV